MTNIDILFERLRLYDEVTILELLDISTEDILTRFRDRVISKREALYGEIELLVEETDEEEQHCQQDLDGFQYEETDYED